MDQWRTMASNNRNSKRTQPDTGGKARRRTSGFTMLELLIVISMGLVVAAMVIPTALTSIANIRLRSAANSIAGVIQDGRIRAVKKNSRTDLVLETQGSAQLVCVDENASTTCNSTERTIQLPNTVTRLTTAPSGTGAPSATVDSTAGLTSPQLASLPSFNARGLPCLYSSGTCTANTPFVIYLSGAQPLGANSFAAVSVSPSGRIKSWFWTGSAWSN
jgi:prepilin-type N-terminal cleavage/methylation domain-containing protein